MQLNSTQLNPPRTAPLDTALTIAIINYIDSMIIMIKIMDPIKKGNNQPRDDIDKIDTQEEEREN